MKVVAGQQRRQAATSAAPHRQPDGERGADADLGLVVDRSVVPLGDQCRGEGESLTCAAADLLGRAELLKRPTRDLLGNADVAAADLLGSRATGLV
jgi:hypothetical protein